MLLGNGDGTFQPKTDYAAGGLPSSVATADVNHDGKVDLVVANANGDSVSVLLGNGDGTFHPEVEYSAGSSPHAVAISDVNGDGKADLVVADQTSNVVSVLLGNGDGTFRPRLTLRWDLRRSRSPPPTWMVTAKPIWSSPIKSAIPSRSS